MNAVADIPNVSIAASALEELLPQLLQLSPDARLEIIARLAQSLQGAAEKSSSPPPSMLDFAGAWAEMPGSDEEIMADIRAARNFTRPEITLA